MRARLALSVIAAAGPACAHGGHVHWALRDVWTGDLWITLPLAVSGTLYAVGVTRVWRRIGVNRAVRVWQASSFAFAWLLLVIALVSPLHWLGERLFTAHMVEHEILMVVAAPLLVVARPMGAILWALPRGWRPHIGGVGQIRAVAPLWSWLTDPVAATLLHGIALWTWHEPALYEAALAHPIVHWFQHLSFFITAVLFWWALLRGRARERGYGAAIFYLFATALHSGFLGILLSIARQPLFPVQTSRAPDWGLTPLEDQQLAGLIMWVPAGLVYAGAALVLAGVWISRSSTLARRSGHAVVTH
jgi:putative membrane protein